MKFSEPRPNLQEIIDNLDLNELRGQIETEIRNLWRLQSKSEFLERKLNDDQGSKLINGIGNEFQNVQILEESLPSLGIYERFIVPSRMQMTDLDCMAGPSGLQSGNGQLSGFLLNMHEEDGARSRENSRQLLLNVRRRIENQKRDLIMLYQRLSELETIERLSRHNSGDFIDFGGESDRK
ncbi:hypothetical protein QAD02_019748 [Eretmocerus hayati]|uniref:Uncharacterized protein n=1 Tax=Eretmocerus hayati TaxID=131215 RepID=A0ACC2PLP1_9HYME|nr:hypothetical protein QAD02_019748 [Eretmocerus hayati]